MNRLQMPHLPKWQYSTGERTSNGENSTKGRIKTDNSVLYDPTPGGHGAITYITAQYG